MVWDRIKSSFLAAARASTPRLDYYTTYKARVVKQGSVHRVDVQPDDPRIPGMADIPLRLGLPGAAATFSPGARVEVGWDNGDPSLPYAQMFEGGEQVINLTLAAAKIQLGGDNLVQTIHGVVMGKCPDPFTGVTHAALGGASTTVMAKD